MTRRVPELVMPKDDARPRRPVSVANDNGPISDSVAIDVALTRIAEAIGRHIAREHIRVRDTANDNDVPSKKPRPPEP